MTSNRIQPAVIGKTRLRQRRFSVPETVTESFEWFASGGRKAKSYEVPLFFAILSSVAFIVIFAPFYALKWTGTHIKYSDLIVKDLTAKNFDKADIVRISLVIGIGMLVGIVTMALLHFTSVIIKMSRGRNQNIKPSSQKSLATIHFLGPYISMSFMAIAASLMVKQFYPNSTDLNTAITPQTATATDDGNVQAAMTLLVKVLNSFLIIGSPETTFYFKIVFPAIVNTISVLVLVLTIEKFILQMIAVSYRSATTAGRFTENAFALSVIKGLFRTKLEMTNGELKPGRTYDPDLANALFDSLIKRYEEEEEGVSEVLKLSHLENCMDREQAVKLFGILDIAQNGDLTKDEFQSGVKAIYDEQETLTKLVSDHDDIIAKLDEIMLFVVYAIDFALCLTFLGFSGVEMLKSAIGILLGFALVFSDALIKLFDALIFVLVTHPYDLGDRVEIGGKYLYVESVGLWTTIFNGPGGLKTIMTNASIAYDKIANFRRSPAENEVFSYLVRPETVSEEAVQALRKDCIQFFKDHNRDFLPNWHLETADQIDHERFKIHIKVFHRQNFQNEEAKNERSQKFVLFFKDALLRNGFVFSPPLPKALAAVL